jgi:hypothetical protein
MTTRNSRRAVGLAAASVFGLTATILAAVAMAAPADELQAVKAAMARYHSFEQAQKDGYSIVGEPCVASPLGTMGIHAENGEMMADPAIDPLRPELLLYVPKPNGKLQLVGIEYWKADADQNLATAGDRPSLFGVPFDGPMPGHNPTMPIHYDLHVWLYADNPSGMFAPFNPTLSC